MILARTQSLRTVRRGFSLLEVLIVTAIILALAGIATVSVMRSMEDSKMDQAKIRCQDLAKLAESFYARNNGTWPDSLNDIAASMKDADSGLVDPWGNAYQMTIVQNSTGNEVVEVFTTHPKGKISNLLPIPK